MMLFSTSILFCLSVALLANGHGYVDNVKGANGKTENGFGVRAASIRPNNQGPASVFGGAGCGVGVEAGPINIASSIEAAIKSGLPTVDNSGSISFTYQQVNGGADGGGPLVAELDTTGIGNSFKAITVSTNFVDGGANSANSIVIRLAAGTTCTGGSNKSTCLVRVKNPRGFGSCFAVASPRANKARNLDDFVRSLSKKHSFMRMHRAFANKE